MKLLCVKGGACFWDYSGMRIHVVDGIDGIAVCSEWTE